MAIKWNGILVVFLTTLLMIPSAVTLDLTYCSNQNTGSDFDSVSDNFQSNGACSNTCVAKYAFAVLQGKQCWCSNYVPAAKSPTGSCNQNCPGYPADKCGSTSDGLFAYFALDEKPSGTATGGGSPSKTTLVILTAAVQSTTSTADPETKTVTVAPSSESLTTFSTTNTNTNTNTKNPPTTTDPPKVSVTTRAGEVVTVTVPNDEAAQTTGAVEGEKKGGSSLGGGAIAGIIIGVLAVVGSAFGLWLWFFCARRRREEDERLSPEAHLDPTVPPSALYNGNHRQNRNSQMSMMRNLHSSNNRLSVPAFTDNRMKKDAVIYGNGARESNVSLQDNQDYSRPVLRLANPDP